MANHLSVIIKFSKPIYDTIIVQCFFNLSIGLIIATLNVSWHIHVLII